MRRSRCGSAAGGPWRAPCRRRRYPRGTARDSAQIVGPSHFARDQGTASKSSGEEFGIPGFDHIHAQARQLPGKRELLSAPEACSGGLLAIAQGRVENYYAVCVHLQISKKKRPPGLFTAGGLFELSFQSGPGGTHGKG